MVEGRLTAQREIRDPNSETRKKPEIRNPKEGLRLFDATIHAVRPPVWNGPLALASFLNRYLGRWPRLGWLGPLALWSDSRLSDYI